MAEHVCDICIHERACAVWIGYCSIVDDDFVYSTDNCPHFAPAVQYGRWLTDENRDRTWCSVCNVNCGNSYDAAIEELNFCGNCGADMRPESRNRKLVERYPFLLPRNDWTGGVIAEYDYSYTELDFMPEGWRWAFGEQLCEEIREELLQAGRLEKYRIRQIKEKYGSLRWYGSGATQKMSSEIIPKYESLSAKTCIMCGEPATMISTGWISPYCDACAKKIGDHVDFITIEEFRKELQSSE